MTMQLSSEYLTTVAFVFAAEYFLYVIDSLATNLLFNGPAGWSHKVDVLDITADTLFIYRLYIVWGNRTKVIIIPIILLIAAYLIGFIGVFQEPGGFSYLAPSSREKKIDAIALFILSFANLLVTTLIAVRIWWIWQISKSFGKNYVQAKYRTIFIAIKFFFGRKTRIRHDRSNSDTFFINFELETVTNKRSGFVNTDRASITVRINMGVSTEGSNNITNNPIHPNKFYASEMKDKQIADSGLPGDLIWNPEPWQNHSSSSFGEGLDEEFSFNVKPVMPKKVAREENSSESWNSLTAKLDKTVMNMSRVRKGSTWSCRKLYRRNTKFVHVVSLATDNAILEVHSNLYSAVTNKYNGTWKFAWQPFNPLISIQLNDIDVMQTAVGFNIGDLKFFLHQKHLSIFNQGLVLLLYPAIARN
ncbi:hypothetical protein K435DRAFT_792353 [Dendrothele bispora CBS 962.96]|uniref:Uncharacterized protein n=1 Tax=Dendrothele bispora (strain CBS 962.96) TaxID=1314807 RepID=A0A4S8MJM2_DENBC|nr:hypothetical protein K435DRAFT_792353 [Dendrothele bispora CBS 962.96]